MSENQAGVPKPKVTGFALVISADGRVKVDNWNALSKEQQRQIAEYIVANYVRTD